VTRPPPYPPPRAPTVGEEELDELGDDAIVAQQAAHTLQPRVQVEMESRTIVVAQDDPFAVDPSEVMETRQLPSYSSANDPTPIANRNAARAPTMVLQRVQLPTPRRQKKRNWVVIGIWIVAGVVAFGFGGALAVLTTRGADPAPSVVPETAQIDPVLTADTAAPSAVAAEPPPRPYAAPAEPSEQVTAHQLPVEKPVPARPRVRPRIAPETAPTSNATSTPTTAPAKSDIPEGI
jgi:hypothetical protein